MKILPPRGYRLSSPVKSNGKLPHLLKFPFEYLKNEIVVKTDIRGTSEYTNNSKYYSLTTPSITSANQNSNFIHSHLQFFILEDENSSHSFKFKIFEVEEEDKCNIGDDKYGLNNKILRNGEGIKKMHIFERTSENEGILYSYNPDWIIFQHDKF
jgi:hypothetical protein